MYRGGQRWVFLFFRGIGFVCGRGYFRFTTSCVIGGLLLNEKRVVTIGFGFQIYFGRRGNNIGVNRAITSYLVRVFVGLIFDLIGTKNVGGGGLVIPLNFGARGFYTNNLQLIQGSDRLLAWGTIRG